MDRADVHRSACCCSSSASPSRSACTSSGTWSRPRRFGVKVTQYFVGFGRPCGRRRRGETEYGVKAIPLGGYVKIVGMLPPATRATGPEGRVRKSNTGMFAQLIADARAAEYELVEPGDEDRLFYKLPWWKKVIVMAGGPIGEPGASRSCSSRSSSWATARAPPTTTDRRRSPQCVDRGDHGERRAAAAHVHGRRPGRPRQGGRPAARRPDRRRSTARRSPTGTQLQHADPRQRRRQRPRSSYERDGERRHAAHQHHRLARASTRPTPRRIAKVGFLGVAPDGRCSSGRARSTSVTHDGRRAPGRPSRRSATLPVKVWRRRPRPSSGSRSATRTARSASSAPAGSAARSPREQTVPVTDRFFALLLLLAGFNLFLGMFNFVPLLPLDGGHIAGALYEAAAPLARAAARPARPRARRRRQAAAGRLRGGRRDPGDERGADRTPTSSPRSQLG